MKPSVKEEIGNIAEISDLIGRRAANLFLTRQLWCSGAVLVVLNRALDGDLTQDQAIRIAAGLGDGMSGSGCICGGLNGAALALGLFLGNGRLSPGGDRNVMKATRRLHDRFKLEHGSTCCRILTKTDENSPKGKYDLCAQRTKDAAKWCADMILRERPELIEKVEYNYLNREETKLVARMKIVADHLKNQI